jgi:hypothetical protein
MLPENNLGGTTQRQAKHIIISQNNVGAMQ